MAASMVMSGPGPWANRNPARRSESARIFMFFVVYTGGEKSESTHRDLALLMEGHVREVGAGDGAGANFHRCVWFFARAHAIEKVLNVRLDGNGSFHLLNRIGILGPRLFPDAEAGVVQQHCSLVALKL